MDDEHDSPRDWVERAQRGDRQAFAELVRRYERAMLAIAYASVGDGSLAGDVTQEAFLRAWQRIGELNDAGRFEGWLARIVRNLAADLLRRRPSRPTMRISAELPLVAAESMLEIDRSETRQTIDAALAGLDELTRAAVVLRYYESMDSKRIAELLDISPAAVDMRLSRARGELRERLSSLNTQVRCKT